ncbi:MULTISPECIES: transcriptional repressor LexA [Eubacterium]|uniref:LexA repressor n=1 Tax=Eubacterium uniforme TaxID=39495 RepID=A0A1T4V5Q5_9FIRM|nr:MULTISPECIES: transcriptional repressor LexA [Eubacterium]MCR5628340.1 transcriptional repressor LexA [Eubacterium sp.]SKA60236.1 SOS-response transcriptional repressor, LexA [Eubacterium uniforme]HAV90722.1 transcriptional repressor LexA [Eubacterium sp.]
MTDREPLTAKQEQIFNFIKSEISSKGYPPSVREICDEVGLSSTSSVHAHIKTLEKKGYIRSVSSKNRAIEVLDDDFNALARREITNVPLVGKVAAGSPILATENVVDYFPFPVESLPNKETFMLTVKGDSMINMGIFDGDNLLVQKQNTAKNGDVIVALVEDSATVKRFYKEDGHIRLQPENDNMDPIIVKDCAILGKVIGLIRMNII